MKPSQAKQTGRVKSNMFLTEFKKKQRVYHYDVTIRFGRYREVDGERKLSEYWVTSNQEKRDKM